MQSMASKGLFQLTQMLRGSRCSHPSMRMARHDDDSSAKFAIKNARKDMRYYTNMTEQLPVASFLGENVHQLFVMAENMGFGDRFIPRMIDVFQKINGLKK